MLQKITLTVDGKEKTYQKPVTAGTCRQAAEARKRYIAAYTASKGDFTDGILDGLAEWVVETYGCQFTEKEFWDGYSGSFLDVPRMMEEIITSLSDAVVDFPKRTPEA